MLDTMEIVLKRFITDGLKTAVDDEGALSEYQFGFRKARSMIDTIEEVVNRARKAIESIMMEMWKEEVLRYDYYYARRQTVFNIMRWKLFLRALTANTVLEYIQKYLQTIFSLRQNETK